MNSRKWSGRCAPRARSAASSVTPPGAHGGRRGVTALFALTVLTACGGGGGGGNGGGVIGPPAPPPGPLAFGPAVTLAANPASVTAPAAAIDGNGVAAVLWSQVGLVPVAGQPALANPYVAARENAAATWAATQLIETAAAGDAATDQTVHLQATAPAVGISAAWLRVPAGASNDRVRAARRESANGWSFGNAAAASTVARSALAFAGNDAGVQALAWVEPVGGVSQVQLRFRRIGAGAFDWTAPALPVQTATTVAGGQPALAVDSAGRVIIVWRQGTTPGQLRSRTYDVPGATYSNELGVASSLSDERNPRVIAVAANRYLVVWEQVANSVYDLRGKEGTVVAWTNLSSPVELRAEGVSGAQLLAGPNATALALWQQADTLFASRWSGATGNWTQAVQVGTGLSGVARDLRAAADANGNAVAVWTQRVGSANADLVYATVTGATPVVSSAALVEVEPGTVAAPAVGMAPGGAAVIAWLQTISGQANPDVIARIFRP